MVIEKSADQWSIRVRRKTISDIHTSWGEETWKAVVPKGSGVIVDSHRAARLQREKATQKARPILGHEP